MLAGEEIGKGPAGLIGVLNGVGQRQAGFLVYVVGPPAMELVAGSIAALIDLAWPTGNIGRSGFLQIRDVMYQKAQMQNGVLEPLQHSSGKGEILVGNHGAGSLIPEIKGVGIRIHPEEKVALTGTGSVVEAVAGLDGCDVAVRGPFLALKGLQPEGQVIGWRKKGERLCGERCGFLLLGGGAFRFWLTAAGEKQKEAEG